MLYGAWMIAIDAFRKLLPLSVLVYGLSTSAKQPLSYLVLADTVEPLMITTRDDPMHGGIVTDVVKKVFEGSAYEITPKVLPWQRISAEMREQDNWIMYGMPSQCDSGGDCAFSQRPIVSFEHIIVTSRKTQLEVSGVNDLFGLRLLLVENFHYPGLDKYLTTPVDGIGTGDIEDIRAFTPEGALRMLRHQRGDAFIDWRVRALYNLTNAGFHRDDVRLTDISRIIPTQSVRFFYSRKLPLDVGIFIDDRLEKMQENGQLEQIIQRYNAPK